MRITIPTRHVANERCTFDVPTDGGTTRGHARVRCGFAVLALIVALTLASCGSTYTKLLPIEKYEAPHAELIQTYTQTARTRILVPTHGYSGFPVNLAVHAMGPEESPCIVMVHGVFSDHECWRFLASALASDHRLVLIDLPGCGESDAPDPEAKGMDAVDVYAPHGMGRRVLEAIAQANPRQPFTLVAHSLGGLVVMHALTDEAPPELQTVVHGIDRVVLFAPLDPCVSRPSEVLLEVQNVSGVAVALGSGLGVLRERAALATLRGAANPYAALQAEADKRVEILRDGPRRRAMQAMLRYAIPLRDGATEFDPDWVRVTEMCAGYSKVAQRTLIISGQRDDTLPISMSYKVWAQIPRAALRVLARCRHSPQIEWPMESASLVRAFLDPASRIALEPKENPAVDVEEMSVGR